MAVQTIDIGNHVECDMCCNDFTHSLQQGGLIFGTKAVGPCCAKAVETDAKRYGEEHFIRSRCPVGASFRDWILSIRDGKNSVTIVTE